jgi:hypothetical protein
MQGGMFPALSGCCVKWYDSTVHNHLYYQCWVKKGTFVVSGKHRSSEAVCQSYLRL